nr:putative mitochondrial protein [Ipomoea batatas]
MAVLLYKIDQGVKFNLGKLLFQQILAARNGANNRKELILPNLIYGILVSQGFQKHATEDYEAQSLPIKVDPRLLHGTHVDDLGAPDDSHHQTRSSSDAIKALQKSVKALELQHDKIENLSTTVTALSASSHTQAASLANLEKLVQQLLTSLGKQPVQEEDSVTTVPTEGISTMADIGDHSYRFSRRGRPDGLATSFRHANTLDHERVPLAAHHMIGEAQLWYHSEIAVSPFASWASFKEECCLSFGPPRSINPLGELKLLFQSSRHIDDYVNDFRAHLARASTVLPAQRVDFLPVVWTRYFGLM